MSSARASSAAASSSHSQSLISATSSRGPALVTTSRSGPSPRTAVPSSITASRWATWASPPPVSATSMNSSSMREDSASAWPCLVTTVPRTSETTSSMRTPGGQRQDGQAAAVGLGEHLAGHGRRALGAAEGQRRGAHRVQPLDQRAAVGRVGRGQPGAEDDEDVGAGGGERIGGVVDDHVPDDAAEARRRRRRPSCRPGRAARGPPRPSGPSAPASSCGRPGRSPRATRRQPSYAGTERSRYGALRPPARHHPGSRRIPLHVVVQVATPRHPVRCPRTPTPILGDFRHKRACDAPHRFEPRSTPPAGW